MSYVVLISSNFFIYLFIYFLFIYLFIIFFFFGGGGGHYAQLQPYMDTTVSKSNKLSLNLLKIRFCNTACYITKLFRTICILSVSVYRQYKNQVVPCANLQVPGHLYIWNSTETPVKFMTDNSFRAQHLNENTCVWHGEIWPWMKWQIFYTTNIYNGWMMSSSCIPADMCCYLTTGT